MAARSGLYVVRSARDGICEFNFQLSFAKRSSAVALAATTRSRITALLSPSSVCAISVRLTGSTCTRISMRSIKGPDNFPR